MNTTADLTSRNRWQAVAPWIREQVAAKSHQ